MFYVLEFSAGMPQPVGIFDKTGKFHPIKEMIPEFVVPDLKDFKVCLLKY